MTRDIFSKFPELWDGFELNFKQWYMEEIPKLLICAFTQEENVLDQVYYNLAYSYWNFGDAKKWTKRLNGLCFEDKYNQFWWKFYCYDEINELVRKSVMESSLLTEEDKLHLDERMVDEKAYELFYDEIMKPHLDAKKQELIKELCELEKELSQPPYELELPSRIDSKIQKFSLEFRGKCKKDSIDGELEGYTYSFSGRSYQDIDSLWVETTEEFSEGNSKKVFIGKDAYGENVLKIYTEIPTFDSDDRVWNSQVLEFLFFDGKEINQVVMTGGYAIASLAFYETLVSADRRMQPLFEKLGWPMDGILWKDGDTQ